VNQTAAKSSHYLYREMSCKHPELGMAPYYQC